MQTPETNRDETIRKIAWRLVPFLTIGYFFASLDRVNVGFAALQMNDDIGLTAEAFGFGAGLFFIAYCMFAVPANLIMERLGARLWLGIVMIAWGIVSTSMALVQGPTSFAVMRFLLGVAEAGFFPGVILYFTMWFPPQYRSRMVAILMMALPVSSVIGSPLSGAILEMDGFLGWKGWHWLFVIEGSPAILLGLLAFVILPRNVESASFLTADEKRWLKQELQAAPAGNAIDGGTSIWKLLFNKYVLCLTLVYIGGTSVTNALSLWQPQIISTYQLSPFHIGLLNSLPFALASLAMYLWASHSDKTRERTFHTALPLFIAASGLVLTAFISGLVPMIMLLCVIIAAASMIKGPFWALATEMLPKSVSAPGIGMINALNNIGVFSATYAIGAIRTSTGSFTYAMMPIAALTFSACITALWIGRQKRREASSVA